MSAGRWQIGSRCSSFPYAKIGVWAWLTVSTPSAAERPVNNRFLLRVRSVEIGIFRVIFFLFYDIKLYFEDFYL